jgi:TRAP-type C4-dicarboxylate transport system permease small subunit
MAVLAFIGSAYAVHVGGHISVDLGEMISNARWRPWVAWIVDAAIVVLSGLILMYGSEFLAYVVTIDERTPGLGLPLALPVGCLIGGAALSIFHVACRYAGAVAGEDRRRAVMDSEPVAAILSEKEPT